MPPTELEQVIRRLSQLEEQLQYVEARFYTAADVADRLGMSEWWVGNAVRLGRIPHVRFGKNIRFTAAHIREIAETYEVRPTVLPAAA